MIRPAPCGGFTLLEVLVVVTIMGISLLAVTPAIPMSPSEGDRAPELKRALQRAAATAARLERPVTAVFGGHPMALDVVVADSLVWRQPLGGGRIRGIHAEVRFLPDGRASGGPIIVPGDAGTVTIRVDPWTSLVTLERSP